MKNLKILIISLVSISWILTSCSHTEAEPVPEDPSGIYVTGYSSVENKPEVAATYWKDGKAYSLTDGTRSAEAIAVAVEGNDVYVAGNEFYYENGQNKVSSKYWKNGVATVLPESFRISGMVISNGEVYLAGTTRNNSLGIVQYWKNGKLVNLTDGTTSALATSIAVSGTTVYVAGYEEKNGKYVAKYWKNGVSVNLTDSTNYAEAKAITVAGNDVYVAGVEGSKVKYWKNGVGVDLTDGTKATDVYGITVSGTDVYVAGRENNSDTGFLYRAKYWKNGTKINLPVTSNNWTEARAVVVDGNDVYVVGSDDGPTYWKNGVAVKVGKNGSAFAMLVVH